jgi:opacity protein-like surface antigen
MSKSKIFAGAALGALLLSPVVHAADMPEYIEPAPVEVAAGGWYLRGDIGASHQVSDDLDSPYWDTVTSPTSFVDLHESQWDPSWFISIGFGYEFNDWFRTDFTAEYRGKSDFFGADSYDFDTTAPGSEGANDFTGNKSEWVLLANAYLDLPSYGIMTPYIGAGIGAARIEISDFTDYNPINGAIGFSDDTATWNFAWALHAGLAFELSQNWTVDLAYRFLYMGDAETEDLLAADGSNPTPGNSFHWSDIASHDIKLGVRYTFD